jgi:predicted nuclease of predicted toxin-antitoxin system
VRFKVDENLPSEAAAVLRDNGHDARTVLEENLGGATDATVMAAAASEERIMITLDLDFADIRIYPPGDVVGIIVLRPATQDRTSVLRSVEQAVRLLETEQIEHRLWVLEESRLRIRSSEEEPHA